jgi:hypothetical protein
MKSVALGATWILVAAVFPISARGVTDPFNVDPYRTAEVTAPGAPSDTPVTAPGTSAINPLPPYVLAGATVGIYVGKTVVYFNRAHHRIKLQPILERDMQDAESSMAW